MSTDTRTSSEIMRGALGDHRTDEQCAKDGARVTLSQIDKLRNQLMQAEKCCQHVIATGRLRHDDDKVWKRVFKAADKLLDGML